MNQCLRFLLGLIVFSSQTTKLLAQQFNFEDIKKIKEAKPIRFPMLTLEIRTYSKLKEATMD